MISGLNASNLDTDSPKHREAKNRGSEPPHHSSAHVTHSAATSSFS